VYNNIRLFLTPAHPPNSLFHPFSAPFDRVAANLPPAGTRAPPDRAQCMRWRRRQATRTPARRDRPRSPYPHRSLRRKRSLIRLYRAFPRSKVGGYEGIRMMKYDSETSYDRVACPPSYLIFPEITNSSIVVSRKKCGGREIFCALPAVGHGSTISVGLAAGTDAAAANLARAAL
jgi:hypothetical protein